MEEEKKEYSSGTHVQKACLSGSKPNEIVGKSNDSFTIQTNICYWRIVTYSCYPRFYITIF